MTPLKQAREAMSLDKFISEREGEAKAPGDVAAFNRAVTSMAGKSKAVPVASKPDQTDD